MGQFDEFRKIVQDRKAENERAYKEVSKNRLKQNISKRMRTSMIGALAAFEDKFGELWGKNKKNLSQNELECYNIWQEVRAKILDQGNNNIRIAEEEIDQYDCSWNRYNYEFVIRKEEV